MNRVVKEHYPVEKLPAELREGISDDRVTVTIVGEGVRPSAVTKVGLFGAARQRATSVDEAVTRIRSLRDEWD
jgi:hypothetical protein